jgi:hypothetical protein
VPLPDAVRLIQKTKVANPITNDRRQQQSQ